MDLIKIILSNWKIALSGGLIFILLSLGGAVWYYKSRSDLNEKRAVQAEQDRDLLTAEIKDREERSNKILNALTLERDKAVSRETFIRNKQKGIEPSNDNIGPYYDAFFAELWDAERAANDN